MLGVYTPRWPRRSGDPASAHTVKMSEELAASVRGAWSIGLLTAATSTKRRCDTSANTIMKGVSNDLYCGLRADAYRARPSR